MAETTITIDGAVAALTAGIEGVVAVQGEPGPPGKSAYQSALEGGYTGTEAEFNEDLAQMPYKEDWRNKKPLAPDAEEHDYPTSQSVNSALAVLVDAIAAAKLESQKWLPSVATYQELTDPQTLDAGWSYLCRVRTGSGANPPGVYQMAGGSGEWSYFSENLDFVDDTELADALAAAITGHNTSSSAHQDIRQAIAQGGSGVSLPSGGTVGQALVKKSAAANDAGWLTFLAHLDIVVPANAWASAEAELSYPEIPAASDGDVLVTVRDDSNGTEYAVARAAALVYKVGSQASGTLTLRAEGVVPTTPIKLGLTIIRRK
jgi:hypothetical protein